MYSKTEVRACPTEKGVYFVDGHTWEVGERYTVLRLLGSGSFSGVCLARDNLTGQQVALKRIPNVLQSTENAKKVLREVCILRRLAHPNIISLKDAFVRPSETGPCRYRGGKLVPISIDVYLALEYAGGGDLFKLRGQLAQSEVLHIMWQLLNVVSYLHSQNVWHRDLKSANVLLTVENGLRVVKVADFGSARSACSPNDDELVEQLPRTSSKCDATTQAGGLESPLTRQVCTPCYQAPEVVMSRGGYTSALDMWSVGCIFAELLQRIPYVGSATTPQLQVPPVFAVTMLPATPVDGDRYEDGPGRVDTRRELQALFDVIGTPSWACIRAVKSKAWRNYLKNLPLRSGTLHRRFGFAGEPALDLLMRLLTFDPSRRCNSQEALMHEIFLPFRESEMDADAIEAMDTSIEESKCCSSEGDTKLDECPPSPLTPLSPARYYTISDPAKALAALESEMFDICHFHDGCDKLRDLLENEIEAVSRQSYRESSAEPRPEKATSPAVPPPTTGAEPSVDRLKEDRGVESDNGMSSKLVADWSKSFLDTEKHLYWGRHGEWTETSGLGPRPGPAWGVTSVPPGLDEKTLDPRLMKIIQSQQMR
ncbi:hypothetical protein BSKO_01896 [Bryopsis sp. KO-2023]|nr:hypothetical protein BSKO_01896 [Bryopsis sp. KO-2023]